MSAADYTVTATIPAADTRFALYVACEADGFAITLIDTRLGAGDLCLLDRGTPAEAEDTILYMADLLDGTEAAGRIVRRLTDARTLRTMSGMTW